MSSAVAGTIGAYWTCSSGVNGYSYSKADKFTACRHYPIGIIIHTALARRNGNGSQRWQRQ